MSFSDIVISVIAECIDFLRITLGALPLLPGSHHPTGVCLDTQQSSIDFFNPSIFKGQKESTEECESVCWQVALTGPDCVHMENQTT